jgi:hypothetical protein
MVKRAEEQDRVNGLVGQVQLPGVGHRGADSRSAGRGRRQLADVQRHQVAVLDLVAKAGQPQRVPARSPADVGDDRRGGRQRAQQDLLGPGELQVALRVAQPVLLPAPLVVRQQGCFVTVHGTRL